MSWLKPRTNTYSSLEKDLVYKSFMLTAFCFFLGEIVVFFNLSISIVLYSSVVSSSDDSDDKTFTSLRLIDSLSLFSKSNVLSFK